MGFRLPILLALLLFSGCRSRDKEEPQTSIPETAERPEKPTPAPPSSQRVRSIGSYEVPRRTDEEFRTLARSACEESATSGRPLLLEAGADWCGDCRLVHHLRAEEPLRTELRSWTTLEVNLGEDQQEWLRAAFRIKAIARWIVFRPRDCAEPIESWASIASRVVEPTSGGDDANAAVLARWLGRARRAAAGP